MAGIRQNILCLGCGGRYVGVACSFPCTCCLLLIKNIIIRDGVAAQTSPRKLRLLWSGGPVRCPRLPRLPAPISRLWLASVWSLLTACQAAISSFPLPRHLCSALPVPFYLLWVLCCYFFPKGHLSTLEMPTLFYSPLLPLNEVQRLPVKILAFTQLLSGLRGLPPHPNLSHHTWGCVAGREKMAFSFS